MNTCKPQHVIQSTSNKTTKITHGIYTQTEINKTHRHNWEGVKVKELQMDMTTTECDIISMMQNKIFKIKDMWPVSQSRFCFFTPGKVVFSLSKL